MAICSIPKKENQMMEGQNNKKDICFKYFVNILKSESNASVVLIEELESFWKEVYWGEKKTSKHY
jgi:hypothetical protein